MSVENEQAAWSVADQIEQLTKLAAPGVIGTYQSVEVTEIVGFRKGEPPRNFLSVLVAESATAPPTTPPALQSFLNLNPITLRGTNWKFGIVRRRVPVASVLSALKRFDTSGERGIGEDLLRVGTLNALPPQFVPPDSYKAHPGNGVLKNNFWGGSHLLELFDSTKEDSKILLENPGFLAELAAGLREFAPIAIDGLSDRLGSILIQLPVTVVSIRATSSEVGRYSIEPVWRPGVTPRTLRISCERYEDTTLEGYGSSSVHASPATFALHSPSGSIRYVVWDDAHQVILGASAEVAFITSIGVSMHVSSFDNRTRKFVTLDSNGQAQVTSVVLKADSLPYVIGVEHPRERQVWRDRRVFRDSLANIRQSKEFIQYGGPSGIGREEALSDLRWLLNEHGAGGAWLWDPYLSGRDVLDTLFYCAHADVDLCALTAGSEPPGATSEAARSVGVVANASSPPATIHPATAPAAAAMPAAMGPPRAIQWKIDQAAILSANKGNGEGLKLEFRIRFGTPGWAFHDRFLIFPAAANGPAAWSLGTSVNSLGQQHHILQRVLDGELIKQAFLQLWDELSTPDQRVWATP